MTIHLLDLSVELLEMIGYQLDPKHCLGLMATCKLLYDIVSKAPFHHIIVPMWSRSNQFPIEGLWKRFKRRPDLANLVEHCYLSRAFGYDHPWRYAFRNAGEYESHICYNLGIILLLMEQMPNLRALWLPVLPDSLTAASVYNFVSDISEFTALRQLIITNIEGAYELNSSHLVPLLALPHLASLELQRFEILGIEWPTGSTCPSLKVLWLVQCKVDMEGQDRLFALLPNVKTLGMRCTLGISVKDTIEGARRHYTALSNLSLDRSLPQTQVIPENWLVDFASLESIYLRQNQDCGILGDSSLLYLSPTVRHINLFEVNLSPVAIAYAIGQWAKDPAIQFTRTVIVDEYMMEVFKAALVVSDAFCRTSPMLIAVPQRDCEDSFIELEFR